MVQLFDGLGEMGNGGGGDLRDLVAEYHLFVIFTIVADLGKKTLHLLCHNIALTNATVSHLTKHTTHSINSHTFRSMTPHLADVYFNVYMEVVK
jgi:hypothetical protein